MSDTRRRRKSNQSCGSDDLSDSYEELNATKETQSSEQTDGHQDSECDIYVSDSEVESQDGALRESGDGQEEEKPQKKLDDDEDRRNPQYIPKRGTFYEHDDRTTDEVTDSNVEVQNERETKEKKVWKDKEDRWDHDRYNDEEQAPKSHEELIAVYGYDIRNEEGPPRARRRRRYGRGPNKYTRNWEDEDAYGKTGNVGSARGGRRFNRSGEDFPALAANKNAATHVEEPVISSAWYSSKNKSQNKVQNFPPLQSQSDNQKTKSSGTTNAHTNENKSPNEASSNSTWKKEGKHAQNQSSNGNNGPSGDAEKLANAKISPRENKRNVHESVSLTASRARGRGFKANTINNTVTNRTVDTKPKGRGAGPITAENRRSNIAPNEGDQQHSHDPKHSAADSVQYHQSGRQNKSFYGHSPNQQRSSAVSSRLQQQQSHSQQQQQPQQNQQQAIQPQQSQQQPPQQDGSGNRPKRYSSLRQRPTLPESPGQQNYPAQHGQHGYFSPQAGNSRSVLESQGYPQGHFEQSGPVAPTAAPIGAQPVISLPPSGQPASYAPPPFLVPPPQFIPPQTAPPSIINYVPGPNGPTFQPNFQGYRGYSPTVQPQRPPPPQELFQPQGCTYYSPAQQQQQQQQSAPMRRPKAAIPILPPPDNQQHKQNRGRDRTTQQVQQQLQENSQSENSMQQTDLESKSNFLEGEQFDSAQVELQVESLEPSPNAEDISVRADAVIETEEKNQKNIETEVSVDSHSVTADQVDGTDVSDQSETILETKESKLPKTVPVISAKTDNELNEVEKATSECTVVEEAVA